MSPDHGDPGATPGPDQLGLSNLRDLGGLPGPEGRTVRPGLLFRSELLAHPREEDLYSRWDPEVMTGLSDLGIKTVIDLRSGTESRSVPSAWADATGASSSLAFPIEDGGEGAEHDYVGMLLSGQMEQFLADDLGRHYVNVLERRATTFAGAVTAVADGLPALVHCTEGKDRTGLVVSLVLGLLGTPRSAIVEDYRRSEVGRPDRALAYAPRFASSGLRVQQWRGLYDAPAAALNLALDHLENSYGTVESYLRSGGLTEETAARLRDSLLDQGVRRGA